MWLTDIAIKRPISRHFSKGGIVRPIRGLVLHIQEGTEEGTYSWFNSTNPKAMASSHFGNPKHGKLEQFVDTDDMAWAQKAGNPFWLSVENEGHHGDRLTESQLANLVQLMLVLNDKEGIPLKVAQGPDDYGLGYHSMGGKAWGHLQCPGKRIVEQRSHIIETALRGTPGDFPIISRNLA